HVEQHELCARRRQDRREARREEFERHDAEGVAACAQPFSYRVRAHRYRVVIHAAKPGGSATASARTLSAIWRRVTPSSAMPSRSNRARVRRSISPGRRTSPPATTGGEALTHAAMRAISALNTSAPQKASASKTSDSI